MPDEMRVLQSRIAIDLLLERENHQHLVHELFQLVYTRCMPRPYLGTHIIDDANAALLCLLCESDIEAGIVDKQQNIGFALVHQRSHLAKHITKKPEPPRNFNKANNRHFARRMKTLNA